LRAAPPRPPWWQERGAQFLLTHFSPPLPRAEPAVPPPQLTPFERVAIPRHGRPGALDGTWYPAPRPRGAVLLLHPWVAWGQGYFHRRGRLQALRAAGYHALTVDFSGFGASAPPAGLYDRDVEDALAVLAARAAGLPLHVWGVSSGGVWGVVVLSRRDGVSGLMCEDVAPHLIVWSHRAVPRYRPAYLCFEHLTPKSYRFIDLRRHAPYLRVAASAFASGALDPGILPAETEELARLAGGKCRVIAGAPHLGAIKRAPQEVTGLALATFERAAPAAAAATPRS
jgi:pimeloyl-ACP methyl ester carboxylesterase